MQISRTLSVLIFLVSAGLTLWLCIRSRDFLSPPDQEKLTQIREEWENSRPEIPEPFGTVYNNFPQDEVPKASLTSKEKPPNDPTTSSPDKDKDKKKEEPPEPVAKIVIPIENLDRSPGLAEYSHFGKKGSKAMVSLTRRLEDRGSFQRALLAWERVIDSSVKNEYYYQSATKSIKRLKENLPPWNPDLSQSIEITFHMGATLSSQESSILQKAIDSLVELVNKSSGNVLHLKSELHLEKPKNNKSSSHMAFWFTASDKDTSNIKPTPFRGKIKEYESLKKQLESSCYFFVRHKLMENTDLVTLPKLFKEMDPEISLRYSISRLMWREFAKTIKP